MADPEPAIPPAVLRSWDQAEAALFPIVMARPDLYQQAVTLIQDLLGRLRESCPDMPGLLAAHERGAALAAGIPGGVPPGVRPELVAAAACAMRYRELAAATVARARLAALASAAGPGLAWVVVEETGDEARGQYVPYQRVEAQPGTGRALIISIGPDESLSRADYRLDTGEVDLATGALRIGEPVGVYPGPDTFAQALRDARAALG
jgi:hypothetical protein